MTTFAMNAYVLALVISICLGDNNTLSPWKGYDIVIEVETPAIEKAYDKAMTKLSKGDGRKERWTPHIAVHTDIPMSVDPQDIETKLREICKDIPPFTLTADSTRWAELEPLEVAGYKFGDWKQRNMRYFQVEYSEASDLDRMYKAINEKFPEGQSMSDQGVLLPHVALIMTDYKDPRFEVADAKDVIHEYGGEISKEEVFVKQIVLMQKEGYLEAWRRLAFVPLQGFNMGLFFALLSIGLFMALGISYLVCKWMRMQKGRPVTEAMNDLSTEMTAQGSRSKNRKYSFANEHVLKLHPYLRTNREV